MSKDLVVDRILQCKCPICGVKFENEENAKWVKDRNLINVPFLVCARHKSE